MDLKKIFHNKLSDLWTPCEIENLLLQLKPQYKLHCPKIQHDIQEQKRICVFIHIFKCSQSET